MKLRPVFFTRLLWITGLVFQASWYLVLWFNFSGSPLLKGADFISFYTAGLIARSHPVSQIYDLGLQHDLQQEIMDVESGQQEFLPFLHPPLLVPLQAWIAGMEYSAAYKWWSLFQLVFSMAGAGLAWSLLRGNGWQPAAAAGVSISLILFYPLFMSILKGQDTAFLLMAVLIWYLGLQREQEWLAGLGLSLALIRPQVAILLAFPFLFRNRKVFFGFLLGAGVLIGYSLALLGWDGARNYALTLLVSAGGEGYGLNQGAMFNMIGALLRVAPGLGTGLVHTIGWAAFALVLVGLGFAWRQAKQLRSWHLGLAVVLSLFVAPHLHYHDLALLLIPILGLGGVLIGRHKAGMAAALPLVTSIFLLLADLLDPIRMVLPYLFMILLPLLAWKLEAKESAV